MSIKQSITCKDMVKKYLEEHGFDGLYCDECGCILDDLMPCGGEYAMECVAGYKKSGDSEYDFYIGPPDDQ